MKDRGETAGKLRLTLLFREIHGEEATNYSGGETFMHAKVNKSCRRKRGIDHFHFPARLRTRKKNTDHFSLFLSLSLSLSLSLYKKTTPSVFSSHYYVYAAIKVIVKGEKKWKKKEKKKEANHFVLLFFTLPSARRI